MIFLARPLALAGLLVFAASAHAEQGVYPKTDADLRAAFGALTWNTEAKAYDLALSHAQIRLPAGTMLLLGADAERYAWLVSGLEFPGTEAVISAKPGGSDVYFEWRGDGHVDDSDWSEVNPDRLLSQYNEAVDADRQKYGGEPAQLVRWLQRPTYDAASGTVLYAVELREADHYWANVVALRLGRLGYAEITWAGPIAGLEESGRAPQLLRTALESHAFSPGHRYTEFRAGDPEAGDGIAGLLEARFRAKRTEAPPPAILGAIAVPVLLVIGYAVHHLRLLFRRNSI